MKINSFNDKNFFIKLCMFIVIAFTMFAPIQSFAQVNNTGNQNTFVSNVICNAVNQLTGTIGRAIAILIVISLAIMLFLGKVSWGLAIAVGVGMGILFGARDVVNILSGGTTC